MDLVHGEEQGVPPLPLLDGRLGVGNGPLIDGVGEGLLHALLEEGRGGARELLKHIAVSTVKTFNINLQVLSTHNC